MAFNCKFCGKCCKTHNSFRNHERCCKDNPARYQAHLNFPPRNTIRSWNKGSTAKTDPRIARIAHLNSITKKGKPGKPLSESHKNLLSIRMKERHANGTAHNFGKNRWKGEPSYPESFFIRVIANEFEDKDYIRELPFHGFFLDFAWKHKKICIEIDGEQHEFPEHKARDVRKDAALHSAGWKVLRIKWKDLFKNPKTWILVAREFVHG